MRRIAPTPGEAMRDRNDRGRSRSLGTDLQERYVSRKPYHRYGRERIVLLPLARWGAFYDSNWRATDTPVERFYLLTMLCLLLFLQFSSAEFRTKGREAYQSSDNWGPAFTESDVDGIAQLTRPEP